MILEELADYARLRVKEAEKKKPLSQVREEAEYLAGKERENAFRFEKALRKQGLSFICEVKKASPSKGIIAEHFPYREIADAYEKAGADCVSCLTEPKWFLGSDTIFREIRDTISLPMIRKDFTVDVYQLYEAKTMGADAVLLICALLDTETIREYLAVCDTLGMSALVETHDEDEIASAAAAGARMVGINNRNLKDFTVDFGNAARLKARIPQDCLFVAESGVKTAADIGKVAELGADAALVGEALMRAADKAGMLASFRAAAQNARAQAADSRQSARARTQDPPKEER